ncbi:MAG: hypothetical protein FWH22_01700 [Fibromonadales bacterium]|nr:hypothetical protein [Fibromonadales bacterium]
MPFVRNKIVFSFAKEVLEVLFTNFKLGLVFASILVFVNIAQAQFNNDSTNFTDKRDGKTYAIVKYKQFYWFAENLDYAGEPNKIVGRKLQNAYDKGDSLYGRAYDFFEAKNVCPAGWHLPSVWDWMTFWPGKKYDEFLDPKRVLSTTAWSILTDTIVTYDKRGNKSVKITNPNGTNSTGMNIIPVPDYNLGRNKSVPIYWTKSFVHLVSEPLMFLMDTDFIVTELRSPYNDYSVRCIYYKNGKVTPNPRAGYRAQH